MDVRLINYYYLGLFILLSTPGFAQMLTSDSSTDTVGVGLEKNYIRYGMEKVTNTYLFVGNASYFGYYSFGSIQLNQTYRGLGLQDVSKAYRDDEAFSLTYSLPIFNKLAAVSTGNIIYSSDTRTTGYNELSRYNSQLGLKYNFLHQSFFELLAGYERNRQLSITSPGYLFNSNFELRNYQFSDFVLNTTLRGEHLKLNMDRENSDIDLSTNLFGNYSGTDRINLSFRYKLLSRDLLSLSEINNPVIPIENRLENRIAPALNLNFHILDNLTGSLNFSLFDVLVRKEYNQASSNISQSRIGREFHEFQYNLSGNLVYISESFYQNAGFYFDARNEENRIYKKFDISREEEVQFREQESLRDNLSSRLRLFSQTNWLPQNEDTLTLNFTAGIFRYDTPSPKNFDDRDELSIIANTSYTHKIDNALAVRLFAEVQMIHTVFLNSSRSAMNNINRVIRLGPSVKWQNQYLYINPRFEVLANYTTYDFDYLSASVRSFSFRQISYSDSLCVYLDKNISLQGQINLRYFERGILYWSDFSESPQNSNLEYFAKILAYSSIGNTVSVGLGIRTYSLEQKKIVISNPNELIFNQYSWGPETSVSIFFSEGNTISLQGWYEFQYINKVTLNKIPNIFLLTNISL